MSKKGKLESGTLGKRTVFHSKEVRANYVKIAEGHYFPKKVVYRFELHYGSNAAMNSHYEKTDIETIMAKAKQVSKRARWAVIRLDKKALIAFKNGKKTQPNRAPYRLYRGY